MTAQEIVIQAAEAARMEVVFESTIEPDASDAFRHVLTVRDPRSKNEVIYIADASDEEDTWEKAASAVADAAGADWRRQLEYPGTCR